MNYLGSKEQEICILLVYYRKIKKWWKKIFFKIGF